MQHGGNNSRRTKAHSNNGTGQQALKVNQSGIMIGLPKVNKPGDGQHQDRGNEFSPAMAKSSHGGYAMLNS